MDDKSAGQQPESQWQFKPGETVSPGGATTTEAQAPAEPAAEQPVAATPPPAPAEDAPTPAADQVDPNKPFGAHFGDHAEQEEPEDIQPDEPLFTWSAAEFVAHSKSAAWYLAFAGGSIVLAAAVYFITKDIFSTVVVLIAEISLGVYAGRKPTEVSYGLSNHGLFIGQRFVPYEYFRSFSVVEEGHLSSISLLPLKRFGQLVSVYFDPKDESNILGLLASHVPFEQRRQDMVDGLMKRIRF